MKIRQYENPHLEAVLSSWERATRLAHPFMTDEFIAQDRIYMNGDAVGAAVEMAGTLAGLAGSARPVTDVMLYLAHDQ